MNMPRRSGGDGGGGGEEEVEEDVKSSSGSLPPRLQSSTPKGALSLCAPSSSSSPTSSSSSSSCSSFSPTSFSSSSFSSSSSSSLPSLEALQVVHFVAVQEDQDILVDPPPPSQTFSPLFSHHFFKENECIVGYDELSIIIYFAPDTFDAYVKIEGSVSKKAKDPSAIHAELKRNLFESIPYPGGFSSSIDDFLTTVRQHRKLFKPPGRVVSEKHLIREHRGSRKIDKMKKEEEKEDEKKKEETHGKPAPTNLKKEKKMSIATIPLLQLRECLFSDLPSDDPFFLLHRRIEWFFHWFIESASPIHIDCQWRVFLPYVVFKKDTLRSIKAHASSQKDSKKSDRHDNDHIIHPGLLRKTREVCEEKSREFFLSELERRKRKKEDIERDGRGNEVKGEPMKEGKGERDHDDSSFLKRLKDDKDGKETDDKYSVLPVFAVYRHQHDSAQQRSSLHDPQHHSETFFSSENKREKRDGRRAGDKEDEKPLAQAEEEKEQEHNNGRTTRGDEEKPFEVSAEEEEGKGVNDENLDPSLSKNEECQNNTHHSPSRSTAVLPSSKVSGGSPSVKKEKSLRRKRKTDNDDEEGREPPLELAYHLAGVCTVYTFYALTGFRRRISQFMIFPHMQRQGVGLAMMEHIYCDAILDLNVLELTVEEPASSFSQLRDVAGLKLLLDLELLPRSFLYPREVGQTFREKTLSRELLLKGEKDVKEEEGRKKHEDHHDDSHQDPRNKGAKEREEEDEEKNRSSLTSPCRIVRLIKETTRQAVRLSEILQLASCLSHPLPPPPAIPREDLENRRDWREKKREEDSSTLSISASILKTEDPPHQTTTASSSLLSSSSSPSVLPPPSSSQAQPSKREGVTVHHPHHERMKSETEATSGHGDLSRSPSHDDHSRTSSSIGVKKSSGQCGEEKRTTGGGIRQEDGEVRLPLLSEDIKSTASSLSTQGGERKTRDVEEGRGYEHKTKQKNSTNIMATPPLHHGDHSRPVTSDHRSDGDPCRDIRLKVKRRLKKENLHWLIDLPALQQKEELQILWNQLYFKYYRTISKLRDMYPLI